MRPDPANLQKGMGGIVDEFDASPSAASLVEGLRDFGYTFNTSSADIVDNAIAAKATRLDIRASFCDGNPVIAFVDNGVGMTPEELREAMRPGTQSPKEKRAKHDLGRFGLGLKTASFAQCRRLTVVTRYKGITSVARWDLDHVAKTNRWVVQVPNIENESILGLDTLPSENGTLVLWENIDRLDVNSNEKDSEDHFAAKLASLMSHLGLVFHRFIDGESSHHRKVQMFLNGTAIDSLNPFNPSNTKTLRRPVEYLSGGAAARVYVLPHPKEVSPNEWIAYEGESGYVNSQGFYLYRVDRLIVWATWFGIVRKSPSSKLLRVSLDIGNDDDEAWQINVLKASANLPRSTRIELRRLLEKWQGQARTTFVSRQRTLATERGLRLWRRVETPDCIKYNIELDSQYVKGVLSGLSSEKQNEVVNLLKLISSDLPLDALFVDLSDTQEKVEAEGVESDLAVHLALELVRDRFPKGTPWGQVSELLSELPVFVTHLERIKVAYQKKEN